MDNLAWTSTQESRIAFGTQTTLVFVYQNRHMKRAIVAGVYGSVLSRGVRGDGK